MKKWIREEPGLIPLYFEKLSMYPRREEPCSVSIPFAQGALYDSNDFAVFDDERAMPTQSRILSYWPDGSTKWLLIHFLADLPANQDKTFAYRLGTAASVPKQAVTVTVSDGKAILNTGAIRVCLRGPGSTGLLATIEAIEGQVTFGDLHGPIIADANDSAYICEMNDVGWEVLERGPVRAVVQAKGKHLGPDDHRWFDFCARIYAYAGKPWLRVDYQIVNCEQESEQTIRSLRFDIASNGNGAFCTGLGRSNYTTKISRSENGKAFRHLITAEELKYEANEQFPETLYGTFWADWCSRESGGIAVTHFQAHQNFPKSLDVSADGIQIGIIPDGSDLTMLQGMAKTHRFYLHIHRAGETLEQVNIRSLQFQMPDRPTIPMDVYERSGVLEPLEVDEKIDWVERGLIHVTDMRPRAYGALHWGDAPERNYTEQGRGGGDWIWLNNEYDFPHAAFHQYARTGIRRFLDYVLTASEHWIDVDICHYSSDPLRYQGQIIHSARHASGSVTVCHQWVEGLLDFYHVTGEAYALEAALGIGENVIRILATPRFSREGGINARESGWALRSLSALYTETGDEKWLSSMAFIVDHFEAWQKNSGLGCHLIPIIRSSGSRL